jgi:hypothetical protein
MLQKHENPEKKRPTSAASNCRNKRAHICEEDLGDLSEEDWTGGVMLVWVVFGIAGLLALCGVWLLAGAASGRLSDRPLIEREK